MIARQPRPPRPRLFRPDVRDEVTAEIEFHVEMLARELAEAGWDPAAARAEARRRFGDVDRVVAECSAIGHKRERDMQRTEFFAEIGQDLRYALRQLKTAPAFTAVAVLTLALGIGATTALWSVVQAVVLRPFPFAHPERVMLLSEVWKGEDGNVSIGNYVDVETASTSYAALGAAQFKSFNLADAGTPERVLGARVTHGFFDVFGVRPLLGRTFRPEENRPGQEQEVVLGHGLYQRRFGGDRGVLGRLVRLDGRPYRVIGVMPPRFDPTASNEELWVPTAWTPANRAQHDEHFLTVAALLKPGVSRPQANAELAGIFKDLQARFPQDDVGRGAHLRSLPEVLVGDYRGRLFLLLGAVAFVLLIACGNVANLLLARGAARGKELAIRAAIGAGRHRIVRQLLTESAVLALLAGVAGVGLAALGIRALVGGAPADIPRLAEVRIDGPVLLFALGTALAASLLAGLLPALRAAGQDPQSVLKEGGRGRGTAHDRVRTGLIVAEVALALTLLAGAGLLVRSALYLQRVQLGFEPKGVLLARVALPQAAYPEPQSVVRAYQEMVARLARMPGVEAAAVTSRAPLGGGGGSNGLVREGQPPIPENFVQSELHIVTPGYFRALGIPVTRGRGLDAQDVAGRPRVMVVSAALARRMWPGENPLGKRVACCEGSPEDPRWKTVVGVAGDVRSAGPSIDVAPEFYLPMEQVPPEAWEWIQRGMTIVVRGPADPHSLAGAVRSAVAGVDPSLALYSVRTLDEALRQSVAEARFRTLLLGLLGAIGLALAAVGIYGVISYFVSLRRHEIGIRMALGATPGDVVTLLTWQGVRPVLAGLGLGAGLAFAATRWLASQLYGVSATDPVTFAGVALLLFAVGLAASLIPARRATRVDPTEAMQGG
jgi:putative ABC transport system permease protein